MAISGLVITYNEEKHIERCVKTLFKVCDEVIIIDSFSADKTAEIAEITNNSLCLTQSKRSSKSCAK